MIRDIIENAQLAVLNGWTALADIVYPNPHVRQVIREGNHKVAVAKQNYAQLRNLLNAEVRQLDSIHSEERKLLAEKQKGEKEAQRERHASALESATAVVRETRSKVISDIADARNSKAPAPRQVIAKTPAKPNRPKAKLVPVAA